MSLMATSPALTSKTTRLRRSTSMARRSSKVSGPSSRAAALTSFCAPRGFTTSAARTSCAHCCAWRAKGRNCVWLAISTAHRHGHGPLLKELRLSWLPRRSNFDTEGQRREEILSICLHKSCQAKPRDLQLGPQGFLLESSISLPPARLRGPCLRKQFWKTTKSCSLGQPRRASLVGH